MNLIKKLFLALMVLGVVSSCQNLTELDEYLENPNTITPENAGVEFLYNSIQLKFEESVGSFNVWTFTSGLSRMTAMTNGFTYNNAFGPTYFDEIWRDIYADLYPDMASLEELAIERNLDIHLGTSKIMKAYTMMMLVDLFGDVPYSEIGQGTDVQNPKVDDGAEVYAEAEVLLDEAIALLDGTSAPAPDVDNFYNGNPDKWITLAKTLKLRKYLTTRLVDDVAGKVNALLDDVIDEPGEDWQWNYGNNRTNPDTRHPFYADSYENSDGDYMGNYYMWVMAEEKGLVDPRTSFYFYRQEVDILGEAEDNPNAFDCIFTAVPDSTFLPDHYAAVSPRMPYCLGSYDLGYFGRDHGNASGIPPDGNIRTIFGLYPAGGSFDDGRTNGDQQNAGTDGALGEGILPLMLSSFVDLFRAELALTEGTSDDAREMLEKGVRASMDKVLGFASRQNLSYQIGSDIDGNPIFAEDVLPTRDDVDEYVERVLELYDNAGNDEERLNVIATELYIALWGNGLEAYNLYRRTCMPLDIQPTIEPNSGAFTRSALYPSVFVNLNSNVSQKEITVPVFWDTREASCTY